MGNVPRGAKTSVRLENYVNYGLHKIAAPEGCLRRGEKTGIPTTARVSAGLHNQLLLNIIKKPRTLLALGFELLCY